MNEVPPDPDNIEIVPDEFVDDVLEPLPDFGGQEEVALEREWEEDAKEHGE